MYKGISSGVTYINGCLIKIDALDVFEVNLPPTKDNPPRIKKYFPPSQKDLKDLFDMGHNGVIFVKEINKEVKKGISKIIESLHEEE